MFEPEIALFYETVGEGREYFVQFSLDFQSSTYLSGGYKIVHLPEWNGDDLIINLYYDVDEAGDETVIHDISLGGFPNDISTWNLSVTTYKSVGKVVTDQDEEEAIERPTSLKR